MNVSVVFCIIAGFCVGIGTGSPALGFGAFFGLAAVCIEISQK